MVTMVMVGGMGLHYVIVALYITIELSQPSKLSKCEPRSDVVENVTTVF